MPLALPARDLVVQYGGSNLDSATFGVQLNSWDSSFRVGIDYFKSFFACEFTLRLASPTNNRAADLAAFAALENGLEALRTPRQRLLVQLAGVPLHDWNPDPAVKTAFQLYPELEKVGKRTDNGLSQRWRWALRCGRPASLSGQGFRQASNTATTYTINGRRVCVVNLVYTASPGASALDNYNANADTFCQSVLPTPVASGEWILEQDTPNFEDENAVATGTRIYWEVVAGLRDFTVSADYDDAQLVAVTIDGTYTKCAAHASAFAAYNADITTRGMAILSAFSGVNFNAWSQPDVRTEKQTTTDEIFRFSRTYRQIAYPQGPGGADDPNITRFRLDVSLNVPYDRQTGGITKVQRLRFGTVSYQAVIDWNSSGGQDPYGLWLQKFRAHCLAAIAAKLQASNFFLFNEQPGVGLDRNVLFATMQIVLIGNGTGVLEYHVRERRRRTGSKRRIPRADGKPRSYALMPQPTDRVLTRTVRAEYLATALPAAVFTPGSVLSGFTFWDTGTTIDADLQAQEQDGYQPTGGWMGDFEDTDYQPSSRGPNDELQTVIVDHVEQWTAVDNVEAAPQKIS